jgi:hypothetical protein
MLDEQNAAIILGEVLQASEPSMALGFHRVDRQHELRVDHGEHHGHGINASLGVTGRKYAVRSFGDPSPAIFVAQSHRLLPGSLLPAD